MSRHGLWKYRLFIPLLILSMVFAVACDTEEDPTEDPLDVTDGTAEPAETPEDTTPQTTATPDDATPTTTPEGGQAPEAAGEEMIEVTISDTEVMVSPETAMGEDVTVRVLNNTDVERDIVIVQLGEDQEPDAFDWLGENGDGEFDRTGLDVVEETTVDAMGEHEFTPDVSGDQPATTFVIVTTGPEGSEALWGEFTIQSGEGTDGAMNGTGPTDGTGPTNGTGTN